MSERSFEEDWTVKRDTQNYKNNLNQQQKKVKRQKKNDFSKMLKIIYGKGSTKKQLIKEQRASD